MSCVNVKTGNRANGFSLVEVLVGMALGLFTVVIIMQVFSVFENQKRTTTAGSDAQENGLMALVQLEQAVRNAGAGLADSAALNCTTIYSYVKNGGVETSPAPGVPEAAGGGMAPVVITDGGANGSDTIRLSSGTNFLGSIPVTLTDSMPQPSSELNVSRTSGFVDGQLFLLADGTNCTVMQVTQVQSHALKIQHNPGNEPTYNPVGGTYGATTWPAYTTGAKILDFGDFVANSYSIDANHSLQVISDVTGAVQSTTALVKDIVSLQAQYGIANTGTQNVTGWVNATGEWADTALNLAHVKRIKAIRVTVVARSGKKEAGNVTTIAPVAEVNNTSLPGWQQYRYRTYTTIIPLRNIIWANL